MVKYATLSVPVPAGREEEAVAKSEAHLRAVRYRILGFARKRGFSAIGKRDWSAAAAVLLLLFFVIGVIIYALMRPPNRVQVQAYEGRVEIGYKGADAYLQALALKQLLEVHE